MGKGSRSRVKNAEAQKIKAEQLRAEANKTKKNKLITAIVAIVLVVAIAAGVCVNQFVYANGQYLRKDVAASSANVDVDGAMLLYFYNSTLNSYRTYYSGLMDAYLGIDSSKSLRTQMRSDSVSWFDSFMSETVNALNEVMALYEDAQANGFTLNEEQKALIKKAQDEVDMSAFNSRLKKSDVDKCLELSLTATFYKNYLIEGLSYTDDEIKAIYDASPKTYNKAGYRYTDIFYDENGSTTYMNVEADKKAVEIASAASEEEFIELSKAVIKEMYPDLKDEGIQNTIDDSVVIDGSYTEGNELSEWLFAEDRQVGDTHINRENDGFYRVYYMTSLPEKLDYKTVNVRHILVSADDYDDPKAKADEIYAEWKNGEATEESFGKLAAVYSSDDGTMYSNGLYENVTKDYMVAEFDAWIYDSSRKAGDTEIIKTSYGYHVMYFAGEGLEAWEAEIAGEILNTKYNEYVDGIKAVYPVSYDQDVIDRFPGIMY